VLETVQRWFTRPIPGMGGLSYEERLDRLDLYPLEFRRVRGNLIDTFKIRRSLDRVDVERMFPVGEESRTRGHCLKLKVTHLK